jgi:insertion element IS1 protein InsB
MALIPVQCPYCQSKQVIKGGKTDTGKQRYSCRNPDCVHQSFLLDPAYKWRLPEIKQRIIDMSLNGSGIRDTARVLKTSPTTVINELKKSICANQCQGTLAQRLILQGHGGHYPACGRSGSR